MRRPSHTLKNECRDFAEWHRGRGPYVLWALDVDVPAVRHRVARAATEIQDLLVDTYLRQPHVTLALCGFPAKGDEGGRANDEFSRAQIARHVEALAGHPPFDIGIGQLATFESAPYLAVDDPAGRLQGLRRSLGGEAAEARGFNYVPHVTVGLYADAWPLAEVHARIADFANAEPLAVRVERICLMSYDPREIGGALEIVGEFDLASGRFNAFLEL